MRLQPACRPFHFYLDPERTLLAAILSLTILLSPVISPASSLLRDIRAVRGDTIRSWPTLTHLARLRADEITRSFRHLSGPRFCVLPDARRWHECGEILGWVEGAPDPNAWIVQAWLNSPGHRAILLGTWSYLGIGIAHADGRTYFAVEWIR